MAVIGAPVGLSPASVAACPQVKRAGTERAVDTAEYASNGAATKAALPDADCCYRQRETTARLDAVRPSGQ
jgi:hypothetical protein